MADVNPTLSIIILNMNGLNNSIKRQRLSDWMKTCQRKLDTFSTGLTL